MKLKVGVFFGGKACEHEISCISGNQALHAIDQDKYEVIPVYIAKNGDMYIGDDLWDIKNYYDLNGLCARLMKVSLVKDNDKVYLREVKDSVFKKSYIEYLDVAFLVMHGTNGEDGALQGLLEMMGLPYTSSGVMASAIGQDKVIQKEVLTYHDLPLVSWTYFTRLEYKESYDTVKEKIAKIGYPVIFKPANLGSSIGIEVVHSEEELEKKIKETLRYDDKILVEKYLEDFKEINCSIIGDVDGYRVSTLEEVLKNDEILSFADKYEGGTKGAKKGPLKGTKGGMANTSRRIPADISQELTKTIKDYALKAYKALDAYGVARIDFMVDSEVHIYLTELNSIPGSLAFYLWKEEGIDFSKECDILIENAIKRYRHKEKMSFSFDTNILSTFKGGN